MPTWVIPAFIAGAVASLQASSRLVRHLERLGEHFQVPDLALGLVVALAADGPELVSAVTALVGGQHSVAIGVLVGSNVFNIAALLGLGPLLAGWVPLHRRVVILEGVVALAVGLPASALVVGHLRPWPAAWACLLPFLAYLALAVVPASRLPLPRWACSWLGLAVKEEGTEIASGLEVGGEAPGRPGRPPGPGPGPGRTALRAGISLVAVVAASILMESAASRGGTSEGLPPLITGAVLLAGVTSLPNAVAAVYLARAGRGAALMSEALNSNSINVAGGLAIPALVGALSLGRTGADDWVAGVGYAVMTVASLGLAYGRRGLGRASGSVLVAMYLAYLGLLVGLG